ncbi:hypothetical protein CHUAL_010685 [Chamberlinius hualienensis]
MDLESKPLPSVDHKLYLIISVALATISFFINTTQLVVLIHHNLLQNVHNLLLFNQAISGLATTFTVIYPIKLVTEHQRSPWNDFNTPGFFDDFSICLSLCSGVLIMAIFLTMTNSTLMVTEEYLRAAYPRYHARFKDDFPLALACIAIGWIETAIFTLSPWLGWNEWSGQCLLPDIWTHTFIALLTTVISLHVTTEFCLVFRMLLVLRRKAYAINPGVNVEELPVLTGGTPRPSFGATVHHHDQSCLQVTNTRDIKFSTFAHVLTAICHLPIWIHLLTYVGCSDHVLCSLELVPTRVDMYVWTSSLLLVNAVASPLLYAVADEKLSKPSIGLLAECCSLPLKLFNCLRPTSNPPPANL